VTEFSGRGVGMDVVSKNLESVGGSVAVDSIEDQGTTITLKIPLTLAIIDGMNIKVGDSRYTIPIIAIKESFRPKETDLLVDPDGNEMIMVRGQCHPILRLHKYFNVNTKINIFTEGILIMVEHDDNTYCIFADELIGQQQVVVKALPNYIKKKRKINGLSGCTLLGDGNISLILDIGGLAN
jgi:two-component system chemotaxis sensor kinase CheA